VKKPILALLIGLLAGTAAFADHEGLGLGIVGGGAFSRTHFSGDAFARTNYGSAGLSLKVPAIPVFWGIYPMFYKSGLGLGITGDFYFIDSNVVTSGVTNDNGTYNFKLDWFLGAGGFVNLYFWEAGMSVAFGARVPVGLSWHIIKELELFLDFAPGIGIYLGPGGPGFYWAGAVELGLRYWFQ